MEGFGIDVPMAKDAGENITQAAGNDLFITTYLYYNLHGPFYMGMPRVLDEPMSQFANNFTNAYSALLTQRQSIGHALMNSATATEMTDLTVAKAFHRLQNTEPT